MSATDCHTNATITATTTGIGTGTGTASSRRKPRCLSFISHCSGVEGLGCRFVSILKSRHQEERAPRSPGYIELEVGLSQVDPYGLPLTRPAWSSEWMRVFPSMRNRFWRLPIMRMRVYRGHSGSVFLNIAHREGINISQLSMPL